MDFCWAANACVSVILNFINVLYWCTCSEIVSLKVVSDNRTIQVYALSVILIKNGNVRQCYVCV